MKRHGHKQYLHAMPFVTVRITKKKSVRNYQLSQMAQINSEDDDLFFLYSRVESVRDLYSFFKISNRYLVSNSHSEIGSRWV